MNPGPLAIQHAWAYLPDLSRRWGELEARKTQIWIQPPGTPTGVGRLDWNGRRPIHGDFAGRTLFGLAHAQRSSRWNFTNPGPPSESEPMKQSERGGEYDTGGMGVARKGVADEDEVVGCGAQGPVRLVPHTVGPQDTAALEIEFMGRGAEHDVQGRRHALPGGYPGGTVLARPILPHRAI